MKLNRYLFLLFGLLAGAQVSYGMEVSLPKQFNEDYRDGYDSFHVKVEKKQWVEASNGVYGQTYIEAEQTVARGERKKSFFNLFGYKIFEKTNTQEYVKSKGKNWENNLNLTKFWLSHEGFEVVRGIAMPTIAGLGTFVACRLFANFLKK